MPGFLSHRLLLFPFARRPRLIAGSPTVHLPRKQSIIFDSPTTLHAPPHPQTRLAKFLPNWSLITDDKWVLDIIQFGYRLEFIELPPLGHIRYSKFDPTLQEEIHSLLQKHAIQVVPHSQAGNGFYSRYFSVPKKGGGIRPILDLRTLNLYLRTRKFRMVTIETILHLLRQGDWFVVIDLQDAYFHISIHPQHQKYLRFYFQDTIFQFSALPFGLCTAPRTFTKCMAPVAAYLRLHNIAIYPYIDDWLIVADSPQQAIQNTQFVLHTLKCLGLRINKSKSRLRPSQVADYIGATINSLTARVSLPTARIKKLQKAIRRFRPHRTVSARHAQHLLGLMASTTATVQHARLKMRSLQAWFLTLFNPMTDDQEKRLRVTPELAQQLRWWVFPPHLLIGRPFRPLQLTIQVTTDASTTGWGAHCKSHRVHALWSTKEKRLHINHLEMWAVIKAFRAFLPLLHGRAVQLVTDNTTTMHYINKQGGTHSMTLLYLAVILWEYCYTHHIFPIAVYVSTADNYLADSLSRLPTQTHEWELDTTVFSDLSEVGGATSGCVHLSNKQEMPSVLFESGKRCRLHGRRVDGPLDKVASLSLSPATACPTLHCSNTSNEGRCNSDCAVVATPAVVHHAQDHGSRALQTTLPASPPDAGCQSHSPPGCSLPPPHSMEDPPLIQEVLRKARKPSTTMLYSYKWNNFCKYASYKGFQSRPVALPHLLTYLRHLFDMGLAVATIKVYLSAIVAHQPHSSDSARLFSHPKLKLFLKGLSNLRPTARSPLPQWSLHLVLYALTRPPFEPLASTDLRLLSFKTLFLVAITSARRASELAALRADPPYLQFFLDKVVLHPDVSFLPKVVSTFHINQPLVLPTLFPKPSSPIEHLLHSLDVRRALAYYTLRTKDFRQSPKLFLCFYGCHKGAPASSQTLSRWLVSTISIAYETAGKTPPVGVKGHSTRAMATSTALLRGVDLSDICRAATWSRVSTFIKHYRLDLRAKREASFGRAVLTSLLQ